ncbi:thioredoxin family protein [Myroides sp. 1354]|uniref:thioredoxin family protein n=1 Tax=Myroides TaxID=76831 RepID=UPI000765A983|nr:MULTISPECIES: thioredoxin family protein [Myroides]MBB1140708.1 thioredoxin family protein [Myroides sp. WP-1]MDM1045970.1 thioredoxin family protein [Myroides sp. R163-1]MDM1055820.1 thioredoxin family protein [Myroides sp. 1354]MDM1070001.1 thioredoxin family protein [Myroides sp. 1372]WHT38608.1 thioredoxin family protein [Myroides sp. mNGS23_01]
MLLELDQDNLQEIVGQNEKVVVQFSATWCGNCRIMKPKFKKLSTEKENITFVIADAEKFPESRKLADVSNLPTFATFVNGKLVNQTQTNKTEVLHELVGEIA